MGRHPGLLPFGNSAFGTPHHTTPHHTTPHHTTARRRRQGSVGQVRECTGPAMPQHTYTQRAHNTHSPARLPVPVGRHPGLCLLVTAPSAHHTTPHHTTPHHTTPHHTTPLPSHTTPHHTTVQHHRTWGRGNDRKWVGAFIRHFIEMNVPSVAHWGLFEVQFAFAQSLETNEKNGPCDS